MDKFTQGTIIDSIRTEKYPSVRCLGVVISARCDLAQRKIPFFHCLTALRLNDWIYEVLYFSILEEKTKNTYNQLVDICKKHSIDAATLLEMNDQSRDIVLNSQIGSEKEREKISELLDNWNNYRLLHQNNIDYEKRKEFLESDSKTMKIYLTKLYNSNYPKFVFLPEKAYSGSASTVQGIVVDLQDIHQISMDYIQPLQTFEYDFQMITDTEQVEKINRLFFFENKDDFVMASDVVKSPWIEYLLQNFSFSFIRIGVENATEDEIKSFCNEW